VTSSRYEINIDSEGCKGCGYCLLVCPKGVYERGVSLNGIGYRAYIAKNPQDCVGCLKCYFACPHFCLDVELSS
jgi:NAD-dependent dihydropyrimidine dehydrogenase PreA subunit